MAKSKKASAEAQACDAKLTKMQKARESYYNVRDKFFEGKATKAQADNALDIYNECKEEYHDSLRDLARKVVKEYKDSVVNNSKSTKPASKNACKPVQASPKAAKHTAPTAKPATKKTCKPKTAKPAPAQCKPKATKPAQTSPKTTTKPSETKSYTVRQGNSYKTFKTKAEAQTCAAQSKTKATIMETNKKPTHKIIKFTAKA